MPLWGIRKIARMQPICNAVRRRFMLKILSVVTLSLRYTGAGTCDRPQNILDLFAYANFISFVDAVHYLHLLYFFCILTARVHQIVLTLTFLLNFVFSLTLRSTLFALIARRCMWNKCDRIIWAAFSFVFEHYPIINCLQPCDLSLLRWLHMREPNCFLLMPKLHKWYKLESAISYTSWTSDYGFSVGVVASFEPQSRKELRSVVDTCMARAASAVHRTPKTAHFPEVLRALLQDDGLYFYARRLVIFSA